PFDRPFIAEPLLELLGAGAFALDLRPEPCELRGVRRFTRAAATGDKRGLLCLPDSPLQDLRARFGLEPSDLVLVLGLPQLGEPLFERADSLALLLQPRLGLGARSLERLGGSRLASELLALQRLLLEPMLGLFGVAQLSLELRADLFGPGARRLFGLAPRLGLRELDGERLRDRRPCPHPPPPAPA
ncbi:MAG TPA: hypothetical protein DFS52_29140, partial [Myxococcales bacterium]|nr:hypothetical protein [Myxococcales bacterium]